MNQHAKHLTFAATILLGVTFTAYAQLGGPSGVTFTYAGYLERDGLPMNETVDITFDIFTQASGGATCDSTVVADVPVSQGSFSITVGPIDESCVLDEAVHFELQVEGSTDNAPVAVGGRTRIQPSLQAYTGARDGDFDVPATLTATSVITNTVSTDAVVATGTSTSARVQATGAGVGLDVTNDADIGGVLDVATRINATGAGTALVVDNNAAIDGTLTAGNLNVTGNATLPDCPTGTTRMGSWCITQSQGNANVGDAISSCQTHPAGPLQVCPIEAILHCDGINHQNNTAGSCGSLTDEADPDLGGPAASTPILSGTIAIQDVALNESAFDNAVCYRSEFSFPRANINWNNGVFTCGSGAYFCCKAAR